ncbi:MAG: 4-hydroxy-3-methylbut-2-enyl diphosphate reductase [Rhodobiaceae bacterium]|nr:4-hydroxy-3-methylbut-2-enyl diphosphate reductase [Rhodobiaceae bacterium]RPF97208.1 MAG: 4-hydroxy-3-methylbut-2-enyl diphosphate reductase [Rhizobiales bacterium TMED227]
MNELNVHLANPRGFCAGVERAIQIVEEALLEYGPPVFVRHDIVHNKTVVNELKSKGVIFVEELDEIPNTKQPIIFSAHGVAKSIINDAKNNNLNIIDATCPLVSKVHIEATKLHNNGYEIILIGHKNHPEVIGTIGQLPNGSIKLIEDIEDAKKFIPNQINKLAYITQTTLSVDDTIEIINLLKSKYPNIKSPHKNDICYATTNRQEVVKNISKVAEVIFVVGSEHSSNSQRLVEVGKKSGCKASYLIEDETKIKWDVLDNIKNLAITAGASAPEVIVERIIKEISKKYKINLVNNTYTEEKITFKLPKIRR